MSKLVGESLNLIQLRPVKFLGLDCLKPVKFLGLVSVMVLMMTMFVDEMRVRCPSCLCQEPSTSKFEADEDPVTGNLPKCKAM